METKFSEAIFRIEENFGFVNIRGNLSVGKFNEMNFEISLREVLTVVVYLLELKSVRSQCINEKVN